jgi:hypothetical protein
MSSPALLHLFARRAKRKCGAAGSELVDASGFEAAAGAPDNEPALSLRAWKGEALGATRPCGPRCLQADARVPGDRLYDAVPSCRVPNLQR